MTRLTRTVLGILLLIGALLVLTPGKAPADPLNGSARPEAPGGNTPGGGPMLPMTTGSGSPGRDGIPGSGFVLEGLAGGDTSLSGSYGTTSGQTVPYDFGTGPVWSVRAGKMLFPDLLAYLTIQQSYFSQNTHTLIGMGGNFYLPSVPGTRLVPYLNATFGASYNTYTGVNAQAGYAWMLGAGAFYPISKTVGVIVEADLSYETAPTGINTSVGSPPGIISRVSDTWSVPVMLGVRYAF